MAKLHAAAVVLGQAGVLLIQREDFQTWALPGGRIEAGESAAQAAVREVFEETGLEVTLHSLVGLYAHPGWPGDNHSAVFAATPISGQLRPQDGETLDVRFFDPASLPERLLWWHKQPILDALAGSGGSAVWTQQLNWPFEDGVTPQHIATWRDQGELPLTIRQQAWKAWCRPPHPQEQTREIGD